MRLPVLFKSYAVVLLACFTVSGNAATSEDASTASDFTLKSLSGENIRLNEMRGQIVLINFWASWCGPCREEMPYLNDLHNKYADLGFTVLGVNVDHDSDKAKRFLADVPVSFPILFDQENRVSELYEVDAMPTSIFIDRDGKVRYLHRGFTAGTEEKYAKLVKALIRS